MTSSQYSQRYTCDMFTGVADSNNPNGYPSYNNHAPPPPPPAPQSHGYYNNQYPSQPAAPAAPAPYGGYGNYFAPPAAPPAFYNDNNGYCHEYPGPQAPCKPKKSGKGTKRTSYNVSGNRVSGNKGDHNGVFNIGNKTTRYYEEEEYLVE